MLHTCRSEGLASSVEELHVFDCLLEIGPFNMISIDGYDATLLGFYFSLENNLEGVFV